jgi:hypothetical protein
MPTVKNGQERGELNFEGFQSEDRTIENLQVRIDFQTPRWVHKYREKDGDWLLYPVNMRSSEEPNPIRETTNLDPYAIRRAFEQVRDHKEATRFLSEAGRFWIFESVSWRQFQEWQRFFGWLRLGPERGREYPEGRKAWDAAVGRDNEFFSQSDEEFTRSRFPSGFPNEVGSAEWKGIVWEDWQALWTLRRFALHPEGPQLAARISLAWIDASDSHEPENWKARSSLGINPDSRIPFLRVEAQTSIEAIAATIYADLAQGVRYGRCKHCLRFFKVESAHGQEFCAAPVHLQSSPCKNSYLQNERRKNERRATEFLIVCWSEGLGMAEIRAKARMSNIRLTAAITAKARKKMSELARQQKGGTSGTIQAR